MSDAIFDSHDLSTFPRLDEWGLVAVGQRHEPGRAWIECRLARTDPTCPACGGRGLSRGSISCRLAHVAFGHRPIPLLVRIRRWRCPSCAHVWIEGTTCAAAPRAILSRAGMGLGAGSDRD